MKSILTAVLFAAALSLAATAAQAIDSKAAESGASSVADMQLRMQDQTARAVGRWEEIRKVDEVTAQRLQAQNDHRFVRANEQLSHSNGADGQPIDARAIDCDLDTMHAR